MLCDRSLKAIPEQAKWSEVQGKANDLLGSFGEVPESPVNMTANGSIPPSAHGEKKNQRNRRRSKEVRSEKLPSPVCPLHSY